MASKQAMQGHGGLLLGIAIGGVAVYLIDHLGKKHHHGHRHPRWHHHMNMCPHPIHRLHSPVISREMSGENYWHDPNSIALGDEEDLELMLGENGGRKSHYIGFGDAMAGEVQSNVGYLPGDRLPFNDYLDDRWIQSEVWDRRTSVYRNDGVLYNTIGAIFTEPTTEFHPEKRLGIAGAYSSGLEDGPRTRQQHAGGNYPHCLATGSETNC